VDTQRLEAFSDGVFAIAITLLILEVHLGGVTGVSLGRELAHAWPSYTGYVISFITIGIMWANHRAMFRIIDRSTHGLIVANLLLLLCVSFVPFPTKILAEHLPVAGPDQRTAVLFFSGTYVVIAAFYNLLWRVASTDHRLIAKGCEEEADKITKAFRFGIPGYALATALTFVAIPAGLALDGALALFYLLPRRASEGAETVAERD
jgi:uncharacterized membrane protein